MDFTNIKIKEKYIGKSITMFNETIVLTNDLDNKKKAYIYNMITKSVFDIFKEKDKDIEDKSDIVTIEISAPVKEEEIKQVEKVKKQYKKKK